jgi:hypothetical protein
MIFSTCLEELITRFLSIHHAKSPLYQHLAMDMASNVVTNPHDGAPRHYQ